VHRLRVLIEVHHLVLYPRREILHIDPRPREVLAPQAQSSVLRRRGQHRAGGVPGHPPHIRFRGAFDGLRGHVFQGTVLLTVKLVNLPMRGINEWSMSLSGVADIQQLCGSHLESWLPTSGGDEVVRPTHCGRPCNIVHRVVVLPKLTLLGCNICSG
jgi:hypothetical protein